MSYTPVPKKYQVNQISGKTIKYSSLKQKNSKGEIDFTKKWSFQDSDIDFKDLLVDFRKVHTQPSKLKPAELEFMQIVVNNANLQRYLNPN